MSEESLYINGQWVVGHGLRFKSTNPATQEVLWEGKSASNKDVEHAVAVAKKAFLPWSMLSMEKRNGYLETFARLLSQKKDEFAIFISQETGKPYWESLTEVDAMVNKVNISFKAFQERCGAVEATMGSATRHTRFKPYGVVAVLGPFNLPGHLPNGHIIPALLAGNTVVFKPSELTPYVGQRKMEIWQEVGLPPGVLNLVQGGKDTGTSLINHSDIDGIFFTGSAETGKAIHKKFAGHPEKILALEMGGNNPFIVWEVNDFDAAAYLTVQSAFITAGQRCTCARRLIVESNKNGENFLTRLLVLTQKIRIGAFTERPEPFMGPVISKGAAKRLLAEQERLVKQGGKTLLDMTPVNGHPVFLTPGIIDVTAVKNRPDTEIFGPFLQVIKVKNFDEALEEANRTDYGLAAGLLSDNRQLYEKFFKLSRAGVVNWNRPLTGASSEAPFGGIGQSGNHQPSAYFATDYCFYPVASIEQEKVIMPDKLTPGISL